MIAKDLTPAELTAEGINILCRELGAVNAARFLRQISDGSDSVAEKARLFDNLSAAELFVELRKVAK